MQDNSANRRKTLIVSVLLFLFAGGGIFLFFVVQGSNDLTRQGKNQNFTYGEAAREGVSSFFKTVGIIPDEEGLLAEKTAKVAEAREEKNAELDGISDWMQPASGQAPTASAGGGYRGSASPTSVPKMAAGPSAQVGGGGGGSKSAGSVSRFGEGSPQGTTSISNKAGAGTGTAAGKGTLGSLKRAQALLGEGLRSDSAMTANAKWNQSFGVGSGSNRGGGGDLAYNKSGLVSLDKIKSGEISSLKMDKKGAAFSPDPSKPDMDKAGTEKALAGDKKVQDAQDKLKADLAKEAASKAVEAAGQSATDKKDAGGGNDKSAPPPAAVMDAAKGVKLTDADMGGGAKYSDDTVKVQRDGPNFKATYVGTYTDANGNKTPITTTATISPTGKILGLGF